MMQIILDISIHHAICCGNKNVSVTAAIKLTQFSRNTHTETLEYHNDETIWNPFATKMIIYVFEQLVIGQGEVDLN